MSNTSTTDQTHRLRSIARRAQTAILTLLAVTTLAYIGLFATVMGLPTVAPLENGVMVAFLLWKYGWASIVLVTGFILFQERE